MIKNVHISSLKIKLKVACGVFSALQPVGRLYPCPNEFPSFISRGATNHIGTRDLCQRKRELYTEFCQHILIHGGTRFFYMPQRWELGQILSLPLRRKACGGLRPSLNPRTRVPEAGMLTTRPSKPSISSLNFPLFLSYFNYIRIFQTTVFREREKNAQISNFMKIRPVGAELSHAG